MKLKLNLQLFAPNTLSGITQENAEIYSRECYDRLTPELQWAKHGVKKALPKNSGDTVSIRRFENIATSTTAITEGTTPADATLVVVKRSATVQEFGNFAIVTEKLNTVGLDDTISEVSKLMGENAGQSIDEIVRDVVIAGTNVYYANGVASRVLTAAGISYADILKIARTMKLNKVKKIKLPDGSMGYIMLVNPYVAMDIKNLAEYKAYNQNQNSELLRDGGLGKLAGICFVEIDNAKTFTGAGAGAANVHISYAFGDNAFMVPDLEGSAKPQIIVKEAGSSGSLDPLNQRASIGWKALFTTLRIDELNGLRYESTASL